MTQTRSIEKLLDDIKGSDDREAKLKLSQTRIVHSRKEESELCDSMVTLSKQI